MSKTIVNRPETAHTTTLEELFIARLGGRREYGKFRDQLIAKTQKARRGRPGR